ncbi:MAG TPA: response regulator transcription factor [Longimicrobiales bacterium]
MTSAPRVIIADDHALVGEGIRRLLQADFDVVDCVRDGAALVESAERHHPDVVVTDLSMPGVDGLDAIRQLRKRGNQASAIVLTMHADPALAIAAISAGASGYVLKDAASDELILAINEALAGRVFMTPEVDNEVPVRRHIDSPTPGDVVRNKLTARQLQVLTLIAEGKSMKQIATTLKISRRTVEAHKYQLMRTLEVHNVAQLIQNALRLRLISVPPRTP